MTTVMIIGATGLVGELALSAALADKSVTRVVAPTRRVLPPRERLTNPIIDFLDPPKAEWWAVDAMICAFGTTRAAAGSAEAFRKVDLAIPLAMAALVRRNGATRLALTSSKGANPRSALTYLRTKGELERELQALDWASMTIVRPGLLSGERRESRLGESVAELLRGLARPALPRSMRPSSAESVADALVQGAVRGSAGLHVLEAERFA